MQAARWLALGLAAAALGSGVPARAGIADTPETTVDSSLIQFIGSGGAPLSGPLGVALDVGGHEVVVANTGGRRIEFFDLRGRSRGATIHRVPDASGRLVDGQPRSIAVDQRGRLFVSDISVPWVDVLDYRGRSQGRLVLPAPDDRLETGGAGAIALAGDGRVFVASRARAGRVYVFDADGRPITAWGEPGRSSGQLAAISSLAVLGDSEVVVTCIQTDLGVQVFDVNGHYRRGFGVHDIGPGHFSQPTGVSVTPDGRIWVVDSVRSNLQVFDLAGNIVGQWEGDGGPAPWIGPSALASDGHGLFAMTELGGNRLRLMWVTQP